MRNEEHKRNENRKDAEKVVNKYKRYCERNSQPKVYIHMVNMYITRIQKKPMYTHLLIKTQVSEYENNCTNFNK